MKRRFAIHTLLVAVCVPLLVAAYLLQAFSSVSAAALPPKAEEQPWQVADALQDALFRAQSELLAGDQAAAQESVVAAQEQAAALGELPADSTALLAEALTAAETAVLGGDEVTLAGARGLARGAVYWGSYQLLRQAVQEQDESAAQQWLLVRDFRPSTRFTRPGADATLALRQMATAPVTETLERIDADLLDTYQARLTEHLTASVRLDELATRRAESAGIAQGYWRILAPAYAEQAGEAAAAEVTAQYGQLLPATISGDTAAMERLGRELLLVINSFRAAPLSPAEQARRAGQLLRFLNLVPVEYDRGVENETILIDFEVQEAVTFMEGAMTAFADLRLSLEEQDPAAVAEIDRQMQQVMEDVDAANRKLYVLPPEQVKAQVAAIVKTLELLFPAEWFELNTDADFDVLASVLDQVETAVRSGNYALAESGRLEAYAIFDFGPEPRLLAFAPQLVAQIDGLFWQGYNGQMGLAQAIALQATPLEIGVIRGELDKALAEAQLTLGDLPSAPGAIVTNAAIIVFREGLESVVILAALMASMVGAYAHYRRPMVLGVLLSLVATAVTWFLAQQVLTSLSRFGERLEAVVSLIAIGVLLLITNWFFHKSYWKDWMAGFHAQKRRLLSQETGQFVGLVLLGFTSMYREGFETVLFLQALVLDAGTTVVLEGVALGVVAVLVVGFITFRLQARLPYKQMLVWTGVLIGLVLITMVGKTVHVMQAVSWLPITPVKGLVLPYWAGLWFGLYATWQGLLLQMAAGAFVIGSYFLAEKIQERRRNELRRGTAAARPTTGD